MKRLTYVEMDVEVCSLEYGVSPCQASLTSPSTGTRKCTNCKKTCQDVENYDPEEVTLRFAIDNGFLPKEIEAIANVGGVSYSPATISLGEDLGQRATLSVTFKDHKHSDAGVGFDPYYAERDYNPSEQGSFWGRFKARQPFIKGQAIRLIRGFLPDSFSQTYEQGEPLPDVLLRQDTRHFFVDSFDGLTPTGAYSISAKDILKFLDGDRAQCPKLSQGRLLADINNSVTEAVLAPTGIGDLDYPSSGYLAFGGKEIVFFSRDPYSGLNANTQLLLHFDGADAATTMTDSSGNARNGTAVGNAKLNVAGRHFGSASLILDGTGDYVTVADNAAWQFAGDFTVDCWASLDAIDRDHTIFSHSSNADANMYRLHVTNTGAIGFEVISSSVTLISLISAAGVVSAATFHHLAIVRSGNSWKIYVDGVEVASATGAVTIPNFSSTFRIGTGGTAATAPMKGLVDEFRVQSEATWTANFDDNLPGTYAADGDTLTIVRAQKGTSAQAHQAQDRVQLVKVFASDDVSDILYDLMTNFGEVDPEYIEIEQWRSETNVFLAQLLSADIAEPVAVNKLVTEIIKQCGLCVYWDEQAELIKLKVLRAIPSDVAFYDEQVYLADTFKTKEQPEKRLSQIWTYFGKRDPLRGQEEPDNYRSAVISPDLEGEENYGSPAIEKIFSRWIPFGGRSIAEAVNVVRLSRFKNPPRKINLELFGTISEAPLPAGLFRCQNWSMQDDVGQKENVPAQITRLEPGETNYRIEAEEMLGGAEPIDLLARRLYIDVDAKNVDIKALHDSLYPEATDQDVLDGVTLTVFVQSGIRVGSTSTSLPSMDFGDDTDWPEDFPITLQVEGRVLGKGGSGGNGVYLPESGIYTNGGKNGANGGLALKTRFPITIRVKSGGKIGGGGGGGAGSENPIAFNYTGGCGGGGAGFEPGPIGTYALANAQPGTDLLGGRGGDSGWNSGLTFRGGSGGDLGEDGLPGYQVGGTPLNTSHGLAGTAIDGISYCTILEGDADIIGPRIN